MTYYDIFDSPNNGLWLKAIIVGSPPVEDEVRREDISSPTNATPEPALELVDMDYNEMCQWEYKKDQDGYPGVAFSGIWLLSSRRRGNTNSIRIISYFLSFVAFGPWRL